MQIIANRPRWIKFTLPTTVDRAAGAWFDLDINYDVTPLEPDTQIALYSASGALIAEDDDDGFSLQSFLSFGTGSGQDRDGTDTPAVSDGRDGATLPAGDYYLAVGLYYVMFSENFGVTNSANSSDDPIQLAITTNLFDPPSPCDSIDFNGDGLFPDTADIDDFLSVFSGGPCSTGTCGDIDFNNDGLFPDTLDIDSLLSVFSGGACL